MSLVLYEGPSLLDGSTPILCLATGYDVRRSENAKTGPMVQTWILVRNRHPIAAVHDGSDAAICGNCPLRGQRGFADRECYVPMRGIIGAYNSRRTTLLPGQLNRLFRGEYVRLGAYGDPAAVPFEIWDQILRRAAGWTGYTHQWRTCDQRLRKYCMASVESLEERAEAKAMGWRTFRIVRSGERGAKSEVLCPASEEAGRKLTCIKCLHCRGSGPRGDVYIPVHGPAYIRARFDHKVAAPLSLTVSSLTYARRPGRTLQSR